MTDHPTAPAAAEAARLAAEAAAEADPRPVWFARFGDDERELGCLRHDPEEDPEMIALEALMERLEWSPESDRHIPWLVNLSNSSRSFEVELVAVHPGGRREIHHARLHWLNRRSITTTDWREG